MQPGWLHLQRCAGLPKVRPEKEPRFEFFFIYAGHQHHIAANSPSHVDQPGVPNPRLETPTSPPASDEERSCLAEHPGVSPAQNSKGVPLSFCSFLLWLSHVDNYSRFSTVELSKEDSDIFCNQNRLVDSTCLQENI